MNEFKFRGSAERSLIGVAFVNVVVVIIIVVVVAFAVVIVSV